MKDNTSDWAYLDCFKKENEFLKSHLDEKRVVFIGDSIIAGWNKTLFFKENPHFINRGINGQTSSQILHRFRQDAIDLKPKCIIISVGTNDIAENLGPITFHEIKSNFFEMLRLAEKNCITVILCSVLPVTEYYWHKKIKPFEKIIVLNDFLASTAKKNSLVFADFYSDLVTSDNINENYFKDGVHPNFKGYAIMSAILNKHLSKI